MNDNDYDDGAGQQPEQPRNNLPATRQNMPVAADPFARMRELGATNAGAIAIETERAIAEAQGQLTLAKKFPRSLTKAHSDFMDACKRPAFAQAAFYSVPRAGAPGGKVTGPSVRFAEEAARCFGNFQYGHRELGRAEGKSEIEVYAWDMENNNYSKRQITVLHVLDTRDGQRPLRDQRDIDDRIANVASKQMRGRILALMPKYMIEDGIAQCRQTMAGNVDLPIAERVRRMAGAFGAYGVTTAHLEAYLEHSVDLCTLDELINLTGVYNGIKEGRKPSEYFDMAGAGGQPAQVANAAQAAAIAATAAAGNKQQPAAAGQGEGAAPAATQPPRPAATQQPRQQAQPGAQGAAAATPRPTRVPTPRSTQAPAAPPQEHPQAPAAEQPSGPPPGAADDDVF